jgi:predicted TIM-barrel fold metal-dependent hydrolase
VTRQGSAVFATVLILWASVTAAQDAPLADHHQHLFSPDLAALMSPPSKPITAADLVPLLDAAGIKRAVVLSTAYIWSQPSRRVQQDYERVRTDNDWTSRQVGLFPDRLIGFCGLNPIKDYALTELARCAKDPNLRHGLKIHIGNSGVDYHNRQHIEQLQRVFRAANDYGMAIVVHMRASFTEKLAYGRDEALVFLNDVISGAPDVPIQIAHLAGAGGYDDPLADQALSVFVDAIQRGDARVKHLWFDVTTVVTADQAPEVAALVASRVRQLGVQRILYGSDAAVASNTPRLGWAAFRRLPLSDEEFRTIANNVPPYLRRR